MNRKLLTGIAFVAVLALVAGALALATTLGSSNRTTAYPGWPTYSQSLPQGCRPVAPGAYSTICVSTQQPSVGRPGSTVTCRPVAPGAFTELCTSIDGAPAPAPKPQPAPATTTCTPVAPGAFTEICTKR
jgi:hypothetical protein